jgi:uncharacterized membrane protein
LTHDRAFLEELLRSWVSRDLLDSTTGDRLLADVAARFSATAVLAETDRSEAAERSRFSVGVWILFSLGTVALAAAIGVWFAREWGEWGRIVRILASIGVPVLLAAAGLFYFSEGPRRFPALARVFLTLSAIATLTATNLLAATYDFHPRHALITFVEALLFGVLAFLADSALLLWTSAITLSIAFGFEIYSTWGFTWLGIERPVPFVGLGFAVILVALLLRRRESRLAGHLLVAGSLMMLIALFFLSLKGFDHHEPRPTGEAIASWVVLFAPYALALGLLAWLATMGSRSSSGGAMTFARAAVVPLFSLLILLALSSLWPERLYQRSWVDTALFTLATLAAAIFGVQVRSPGLINVAVVFFAIDVFARFSEWFWDEMPAVYFFGLMGLLLILGGISLEKLRRRLLRRIAVQP